jgi:hypothetical protein
MDSAIACYGQDRSTHLILADPSCDVAVHRLAKRQGLDILVPAPVCNGIKQLFSKYNLALSRPLACSIGFHGDCVYWGQTFEHLTGLPPAEFNLPQLHGRDNYSDLESDDGSITFECDARDDTISQGEAASTMHDGSSFRFVNCNHSPTSSSSEFWVVPDTTNDSDVLLIEQDVEIIDLTGLPSESEATESDGYCDDAELDEQREHRDDATAHDCTKPCQLSFTWGPGFADAIKIDQTGSVSDVGVLMFSEHHANK